MKNLAGGERDAPRFDLLVAMEVSDSFRPEHGVPYALAIYRVAGKPASEMLTWYSEAMPFG